MKKIEDQQIRVKPNGKGWSVYRDDKPVQFLNQNYFLDQVEAERSAYNLRKAQLKNQIEQITGRRFFAVL